MASLRAAEELDDWYIQCLGSASAASAGGASTALHDNSRGTSLLTALSVQQHQRNMFTYVEPLSVEKKHA